MKFLASVLLLLGTIAIRADGGSDASTSAEAAVTERRPRFLSRAEMDEFDKSWETRNDVRREIARLYSGDALERARGAARLRELSSPYGQGKDITAAKERLFSLLADDAPVYSCSVDPRRSAAAVTTVGREAAWTLADFRPFPVERMSSFLKDPTSDFALAYAIKAVAFSRAPELAPKLVELLEHDAGEVRVAAAEALERLAPDRCVTPLQSRIRHETEVLSELLVILSRLDADQTAAEIISHLGSADAGIREQAARAAHTCAYSRLPRTYHDVVAPVLVETLLHDPSTEVRCHAASAFPGSSTNDAACEALRTVLREDDSADVRAACVGSLGSERWSSIEPQCEALLRALDDDARPVRWHAAQTLGRMIERQQVTMASPPGFAQRLQDRVIQALVADDDGVAYWAPETLGRLPTTDLKETLFRLLSQRKSLESVVRMLRQCARDDPVLISTLDVVATDPALDDAQRGFAAYCLGHFLGIPGVPDTSRMAGYWWRDQRNEYTDEIARKQRELEENSAAESD
ncbi:MAG: HEAT repeat domain-containing protein [Polyangiaceae bacterium]|nr:HEAT repeat domain-containing protein [Polyangiaceae bacterium]